MHYECIICYQSAGHRNNLAIKSVDYVGLASDAVVSGSDDGLLFIWCADSGRLLTVLPEDPDSNEIISSAKVSELYRLNFTHCDLS